MLTDDDKSWIKEQIAKQLARMEKHYRLDLRLGPYDPVKSAALDRRLIKLHQNLLAEARIRRKKGSISE